MLPLLLLLLLFVSTSVSPPVEGGLFLATGPFLGAYNESYNDVLADRIVSCLSPAVGSDALLFQGKAVSVCVTSGISVVGDCANAACSLCGLDNTNSWDFISTPVVFDFTPNVVTNFGTYIGGNGDSGSEPNPNVDVQFLDTDDTVVFETNILVYDTCEWQWYGWNSNPPDANTSATKVRIASVSQTKLLNIDNTQVDFYVPPPSPSVSSSHSKFPSRTPSRTPHVSKSPSASATIRSPRKSHRPTTE